MKYEFQIIEFKKQNGIKIFRPQFRKKGSEDNFKDMYVTYITGDFGKKQLEKRIVESVSFRHAKREIDNFIYEKKLFFNYRGYDFFPVRYPGYVDDICTHLSL